MEINATTSMQCYNERTIFYMHVTRSLQEIRTQAQNMGEIEILIDQGSIRDLDPRNYLV